MSRRGPADLLGVSYHLLGIFGEAIFVIERSGETGALWFSIALASVALAAAVALRRMFAATGLAVDPR